MSLIRIPLAHHNASHECLLNPELPQRAGPSQPPRAWLQYYDPKKLTGVSVGDAAAPFRIYGLCDFPKISQYESIS